uniref:Uncharacterized protein n=1 Tax=viral metagenome TaxID=1070528 RepID=A0A6C0JLF8_9ZZZZ
MYNFLWPKAKQTQVLNAGTLNSNKANKIKKETCDLCHSKRPINKWYSDEFFICNKCASCEHCNKLDDKIKRELDINEITQICQACT